MAFIYSLADTWNDGATTFTGIGLDVTNTASSASSLLMDLQVGGTSKFSVTKDGLAQSMSNTGGGFRTNLSGGNGFEARWGPGFVIGSMSSVDGTLRLRMDAGAYISWNNANLGVTSPDLFLYRDAAGTLAQRNGFDNPQTFNLYNTYTSATIHERGFMRWNSNVLEIGTEAGSEGGTVREWSLGITNKKVVSGSVAGATAVIANSQYFSARSIAVSNTELSSLRDIWINSSDGVRFKSGLQLTWSSSATNSAIDKDSGIARTGASQLKITDGSTGTGELIFIVPTSDPGITGALWNNGGTLAISA